MLELKKTPEHTIDRVFLLALLALFAATAFLVVSIGAKQYHSIADSMTANYETRTVSSYLEEKMNQNDVAGSVAVTSIGDFPPSNRRARGQSGIQRWRGRRKKKKK